MNLNMFEYIFICVYMYDETRAWSPFPYTAVAISMYVCIYMYVFQYICIHVYIFIYIYMYDKAHASSPFNCTAVAIGM